MREYESVSVATITDDSEDWIGEVSRQADLDYHHELDVTSEQCVGKGQRA